MSLPQGFFPFVTLCGGPDVALETRWSLMNKYWKVDVSTVQHRLCVAPYEYLCTGTFFLPEFPFSLPGQPPSGLQEVDDGDP